MAVRLHIKCKILDSTFLIFGLHTFAFGLHCLVALHA